MKRNIRHIVTGTAFLSTMGISSLLPVLPAIASAYSISLEASGLIIAVYALPGFFLIPLTGVLADRFGRKSILMPSLVIFVLGSLGCMFATSFIFLLLARAVQGVGAASFGTLCSTITADTWEGKDRARMMGLNGLMLGLGTAFSPALGGILGIFGWRFPFLLALLALPVGWLAWKTPLMKPQMLVPLFTYFRASWDCVRKPESRLLIALGLCTFIILSGPIVVCFPLFAAETFQANSLEIGLIMAIASFASGLLASRLSFLYNYFSPKQILLASQVFYCAAMISMPFVSSLWWLIIPILLYGAGQGLNIPLVTTLLTGQAPDAMRGALMATNAMTHRFAQATGPLLFSQFAGLLGAGNAIILGSVFAIAMMVLVIRAPLPSRTEGYQATPYSDDL